LSISVETGAIIGDVKAYTTSHRGMTPEEIVELLVLPKLLHVAETAAPALREQAEMFKSHVRALLVRNMHQAIKSDRTTLAAKFRAIGQTELADQIPNI
jgi:phospholipase/lecithinase/hemolysin